MESRSNKRRKKLSVLAVLLCLLALAVCAYFLTGCTTAEWKEIGTDAVETAPAAVGGAIADPTPIGVGAVILSYLLGLVSNSAARGFGTTATSFSTWVANSLSGFRKGPAPVIPPPEVPVAFTGTIREDVK